MKTEDQYSFNYFPRKRVIPVNGGGLNEGQFVLIYSLF